MPYLTTINKLKFEDIVCRIIMNTFNKPGDLNYLFTELIKRYVACQGESYTTYNDIIGALECCQFELYRRKVGPYENKKCTENGDVYGEPTI